MGKIALEVARVSGARLRHRFGYNRWEAEKSDPEPDSKIPRFIINTRISVSRSRQEILKKLQNKKCRS